MDKVDQSPDPFTQKRDNYIERLEPIFLPPDPISNDIIRYFASLLRVVGMEDRGWDPPPQAGEGAKREGAWIAGSSPANDEGFGRVD